MASTGDTSCDLMRDANSVAERKGNSALFINNLGVTGCACSGHGHFDFGECCCQRD